MSRYAVSLKALLAPAVPYPVIVMTKLWADASPHGIFAMLTAAALIAGADILAEAHVGVAVFLYSSAIQMVIAVAMSALTVCLLFTRLGDSPLVAGPGVAITWLGIGAMVGFAVRNRFLASS